MGRTVLMNMLEAHSDYHSASSRIRYYTPLDDSGIASINIMEGYSSARRGMSQPHRPQKDPTLTGYRSEPRPREIRFKVSLAFVLMLFRRKVREATENLRLSPLMNLYLDRWCLHHPARGLEHLIMHLGEVSSNGTSLVTRKRDRSQRAFIQESNAPASSSRDIGFKQALERCLASLEEVLEEARGFSISTGRAGIYFGLIASDMKAQLDRLDLWAVNEVVFRDCGFGDLVPDNAMECVTVALKRITSAAENIRKEMAFLGSLASQGPAEQTGKKIGPGDSLAGQDFIEEIGKDVALLDLLVAENTFADLATLVRKLDTSSSRIEAQSKEIAFELYTLVSLTDCVSFYQACVYQDGPVAVRQQEIQRDRSDVETKTRLQEHDQEISQDEPVIQLSTRTSTSSWYSEDDDQYIPMPYEQIVEASLAEQAVDTGCYWGDTQNLLDDYSEAGDSTSTFLTDLVVKG